MKSIYYTLLSCLLLLGGAACKKDSIAHSSDFNGSYLAWLDFKQNSNNTYQYTVNFGSWSGYGNETTIVVRDGKVVGRSYIATQLPREAGGAITILGQWTEDESDLNSHKDGALSRTLDDIYREAKDNWLLKRDDADTYFEARNNGLISTAGYVPKGCQDDCLVGISISKVEAL